MVLVCQSCHSRYHVDPHVLGEGRRVRCVSCGHVWHQEIARSRPQGDVLAFPEEKLEALSSLGAASVSSGSSSPVPRSRMKIHLLIFGLLSGVILIPLSFLFQKQDFPLSFARNLNSLISFFGATTENPYDLFKIGQLRSEVIADASVPRRIRLEGHIRNTSQQVQALPPLKVYFWGNRTQSVGGETATTKKSRLLGTRTHQLEQSHLLPGESLTFSFIVPADFPELAATSVGF